MPDPRQHSLIRRVGVTGARWLAIALVTILIGEGIARLVFGIRPLTTESLVWRHHPMRGWDHTPNAEDIFVKPGFEQRIKINSLGLREREIPYARTPGTTRILVIGDSSVVSFEVAPEEVFTRVAEDFLRARGYEVEFINAGVRGYGTDQALLLLEEEGVKYKPDIVLYKWTDNDREDNATVHRPFRKYGKPYFVLDENGSLVLRATPVPASYPYVKNLRLDEDGILQELPVDIRTAILLWIRDMVLCRSSLATALTRIAISVPAMAGPMKAMGSYDDSVDVEVVVGSRLFRTTVEMVREMERVSNAAGAEFGMIHTAQGWGKILKEKFGFRSVEAHEIYLSRIPERPTHLYTPHDSHWNAAGHRVYGESLAEALIASGLLTPPGPGPRGE